MFATGSCCGTAAATSFPCRSYSTSSVNAHRPPNFCSLPNPNFFRANSNFTSILTQNAPRLTIFHTTRKESKPWVGVSCLVNDSSEGCPESGPSSVSNDSTLGSTIDIKLPRRSLLVYFTCNSCGVRSQRLINRLAYEKGTVYVQCSGCSQYHQLVDNLNLVVEYDLREVADLSSDMASQA